MTVSAIVETEPPQQIVEGDNKIIPITSLRTTQERKKEFTAQLTQHHRDVLVYARAIVFDSDQARDLVQESCLVAWTQYAKYDATKADFGTWLRGILRNKIRDWVKSKKGGSRPEVSLDEDHLVFLENHFNEKPQESSFDSLKNCLKRLPTELHKPIQLTYYDGYAGQEASETLGINYATLRKRLSRARQALHDCISRKQS